MESPKLYGKATESLPDSTYFFEPEEVDAPPEVDDQSAGVGSRPETPIVATPLSPPLGSPRLTRPLHKTTLTTQSLVNSQEKKMHQTSTRIMRTNPEGRPFASDFHDLFATLMVSLPLKTHKSLFRSYPFSFTTEEALLNLANLKFAQSNRMPDPNDLSRVVTTTTTTTFSMAKDMAKALCQRFMDAKCFEAGADRSLDTFKDKTIWSLTPKGICKLSRFVMRNGIVADHISKLLSSSFNTMQLMTLERDSDTDAILCERTVIEIIFRRFAGKTPNAKTTPGAADTDSVSEYLDGFTGVKLAELRRVDDQTLRHTFTGRTAIHWLMQCTTVLDLDEAHQLAQMFVQENLIQYLGDARGKLRTGGYSFQSHKSDIYILTPKGRKLVGWEPNVTGDPFNKNLLATTAALKRLASDAGSSRSTSRVSEPKNVSGRITDAAGAGSSRETNSNRLYLILGDPALRSQFREFLRENYCEENLTFYQDVIDFVRQINHVQALDGVSEGLAKAYSIYNAYLASGSPCELNLDHQLRLEMAAQMTKAVDGDETSMYAGLARVAELYDRAQKQVFRLMAGDSVPKFLKTPLYLELMEGQLSEPEEEENDPAEASDTRKAKELVEAKQARV